MSQTLSELGEELDSIFNYLESDNPEDIAIAEQLLDDLMPQLASKVDSYIGLINHYRDSIDNISQEESRLGTRKQVQQNKLDQLKSRLQEQIELRAEQLGDRGKKLEGYLHKVSLVNNGGKLPLEVNKEIDINEIPSEFISIVTKIDPEKVREYLESQSANRVITKSGLIIASLLPRGKHLRIS
jgi:Siphovirus Gp157